MAANVSFTSSRNSAFKAVLNWCWAETIWGGYTGSKRGERRRKLLWLTEAFDMDQRRWSTGDGARDSFDRDDDVNDGLTDTRWFKKSPCWHCSIYFSYRPAQSFNICSTAGACWSVVSTFLAIQICRQRRSFLKPIKMEQGCAHTWEQLYDIPSEPSRFASVVNTVAFHHFVPLFSVMFSWLSIELFHKARLW